MLMARKQLPSALEIKATMQKLSDISISVTVPKTYEIQGNS